mmetsp:Transcript_25021/g.58694  ORF Transcript_25021/g.58694 Transcript_25021/m.58694 type:complete len:574 (+) Transcript_25021:312-2033(+)|eukprot:CAMPEP_0168749612 /NCGR_PEP_ID=MMETSP0724-20121128/16810_1 /TAXON_ID=265536 /ORGANISM="Amphiprora sp., Strain CCMP467" /LENGTH=573 /DNA_ID=CAMNT_0008797535 /DNA_START=315 /DNA_END=2036 /DNA_ORIENTATION=+
MDAPPAPAGSPELYMTPQLQKRRDGLCPGLFVSFGGKERKVNGGLCKEYRTNSKILLQVEEREGIPREILELQTLVDSVSTGLKDFVSNSRDVISLDFVPKGCTWIIELNSGLNEADENFRLDVRVLANDIQGVTNYVAETILQPLQPGNGNAPGMKEAKPVFDLLCIAVRKSVVRLEFPEFPEGCKGVAFREIYQLNARLKSGSFATVCRGTHRATGRKVAIKCVLRKDLPPSDDAAIYDEVAILASLNHPHIVPIIDFFDEKDCYFIVMELMSGGDLFDRIGQKKTYSEADARDLVIKMLKAVAFCHVRSIAHCDMKPKNLLLMSDDNDSYIKLADFGFSARVHEPKSLSKQCGTPFFVAPEILLRKGYDQQSDMWSVGCIIFLLLSGNLPFMGRSQKELFRKIVAGKFEFKEDDWEGVSDEARDLVRGLLILDPDKRLTAKQAVRHKWLKASRDSLSLINLQNTSQRLKTFNARMKLRSAVIAIDWVASLKRMSFFSSRNLPDDASVGSSASHGSARLLAVAAIANRSDVDSDGYKLGGGSTHTEQKKKRDKLEKKSKKSKKSEKKTTDV